MGYINANVRSGVGLVMGRETMDAMMKSGVGDFRSRNLLLE